MRKFLITVDVTMSDTIEIEAENEEKARELAVMKSYTPYDLRDFHFLSAEVYDAEEVEDEDEQGAF